VTATDCHFAVLSKEDYLYCLLKAQQKEVTLKIDFLAATPIFARWSKGHIRKIVSFFATLSCKKGQVQLSQGSENNDVFIVVEGEFQVSRKEHCVGDIHSENTARQFLKSDLS
jgi:CRP-like cAMP-binding protein